MDRPFIGRSISYRPPPSVSPDTLIPAATIATSVPLPAPVPSTASSLGVHIPLTMPLKVVHRLSSDPAPPPLPPKAIARVLQTSSPLASPASNPSPLSTPGRDQIHALPHGFIAIPQATYSALMSPSHSQTSNLTLAPSACHVPTPLSTPGREDPPNLGQRPAVPATSSEAATLHATMVAAAVAAATAQIERSQSALSEQSSSTSSSITVMPHSLQAGGFARKPVPTLFALSNAATQQQQPQYSTPYESESNGSNLTRQLTLPQMVVTSAEQPQFTSVVPGYSNQPTTIEYSQLNPVNDPNGTHRNILLAGPASIPLSRYGTRGASSVPQPVIFTSPQRSQSISRQPSMARPPSEALEPSSSMLSQTTSLDSHGSTNDLSSSSLSLNRSKSSLALLAPLTKFPDPAFPRRPLVLSEHLSRFRRSSAAPASPSSLWHESTDGKPGELNRDGGTKQRRKVLGTMFRTGKGAAIKWVGKDGLLGEDESWTIQRWGLVFTVTTVSFPDREDDSSSGRLISLVVSAFRLWSRRDDLRFLDLLAFLARCRCRRRRRNWSFHR